MGAESRLWDQARQPCDRPFDPHWRFEDRNWIEELLRPLHPLNSKHVEALEALLAAACVAYHCDGRWTSYSRRHSWWSAARGYFPLSVTYARVRPAVDLLAAVGLFEHDRKRPGNLGYQSRFRLLCPLTDTAPVLVRMTPREPIILRDTNGTPINYPETNLTRRLRRNLAEINEMMVAAQVDFCDEAPIVRLGNLIRFSPECAVYLTGNRLHRVFTASFSLHGRYYGPSWQNFPKQSRVYLSINGQATTELDFGQTHVRMLAAERNVDFGDADIYEIPTWPRPQVKTAMNILINARTPESAIRAIAQRIGGAGARKRAVACVEAIKHRYPQLTVDFGSGAGLRLMRRDAGITEAIIRDLHGRGIAVLPLHDSYLVERRYEGILRDVMESTWIADIGTKPVIKSVR